MDCIAGCSSAPCQDVEEEGTMVFLVMMAAALLLIYAGSAVYLYYGYKNNLTL